MHCFQLAQIMFVLYFGLYCWNANLWVKANGQVWSSLLIEQSLNDDILKNTVLQAYMNLFLRPID